MFPVPNINTVPSTLYWRAFWREQSRQDGTDWRPLIEAAESVLARLRLEKLSS
jgi:hypothetical protein